jgi:hypothetical protein
MNARFIVHHPRRLVYAELPKCASTTMHRLFLDVSGIHDNVEPHYGIWREPLAAARRAAGLEAADVADDALDAFVRRHRGYRFFTVVRNPYGRCLSGYGQQVRRYAKRFRRLDFARAKLTKLLSRRLPGDEANPHRVVTETLRLGRIPYDSLVHMEDLAAGLRDLFPGADDLARIPACNVTRSGEAVDQLAPDTRRAIHELYEPDFSSLGYAA